jgi:predicted dienelactone hydrolase
MPDGTLKEKYWNSNHDCFDLEFRRKHLAIRVEEARNLIDEITREGFLKEYCEFSDQIDLETDKLIMGGHSFGGTTAIAVSE